MTKKLNLGFPYGTPEYGRAWRDHHRDKLTAERKEKYHTEGKSKIARRAKRINAYKLAKGCEMCGYNEHSVALDFDHINPKEKKFSVSHRLQHSTIKTLIAEIRKCRVLCANCHRVKTQEERFEN